MADFTEYTYDPNNDICEFFSKFNFLLQDLDSDVVQIQGKLVENGFFLRSPELANSRWCFFGFDGNYTYIGSNSDGDDPIGIAIDNVGLRVLLQGLNETFSATSERGVLAKDLILSELAEVTGINPSLTFTDANLRKSLNVVKNLNISATSTTATITIADDSAGLGQVLSCYVDNNSASSVAITIVCPDTIKYPQNLDLGVTRLGNVIAITANKEYLITFLRSKTGIWSFNILEQND